MKVVGALILGFAVTRHALHGDGLDLLLCRRSERPRIGDFDQSAFAAITALIASLVLLLAHAWPSSSTGAWR